MQRIIEGAIEASFPVVAASVALFTIAMVAYFVERALRAKRRAQRRTSTRS